MTDQPSSKNSWDPYIITGVLIVILFFLIQGISDELAISYPDIIFFLTITLVLWLIVRQITLWYYRINYRIKLQEEQIRLLKKIAGETSEASLSNETSKTDKPYKL